MLVPLLNDLTKQDYPIRLAVFGSTGSIGQNTLKIVKNFPDKFKISALVAGSNHTLLLEQAKIFNPSYVGISDCPDPKKIEESLNYLDKNIKFFYGKNASFKVAELAEYDLLVATIVGMAGLSSTCCAIKQGKKVALANKESLVCAGQLLTKLAKDNGTFFLPIDSEHSAIWQSLLGNNRCDLKSVILTASGGPFYNLSKSELKNVTKSQALKHPNWSMGPKITVDSSTLFNKALEVIEARWLFELNQEQIEVVVHPQSVIHSMVRYIDGSIIMQASVPDMMQAIGFALNFPNGRLNNLVKDLDYLLYSQLKFEPPDLQKFPALTLAYDVIRQAKNSSAGLALNTGNELAVNMFLQERLSWYNIFSFVEKVYSKYRSFHLNSLDDIIGLDQEIRSSYS